MKSFNSVQELWEYCQFCPLCQDSCRIMRVKVDPDDAYKLISFEKTDDQLKLHCVFSYKRELSKVVFEIDTHTNSLKTTVSDPVITIQTGGQFRAKKAFVVFQLFGDCDRCACTHATSAEMELGLTNKEVGPPKVDREGVYLLENNDKFHITLIYDRNVMLVSRCFLDEDDIAVDDNKVLELPLVKLDFSNQEKVINKINTLILFS